MVQFGQSNSSGTKGGYLMEKQGRGRLTERIKEKSKELLGYEISQEELRLMPYIQSVMANNQKIDPSKVNQPERIIMRKWIEAGHMEGGMTGLGITKEFWDILCEIVFLGYVDLE